MYYCGTRKSHPRTWIISSETRQSLVSDELFWSSGGIKSILHMYCCGTRKSHPRTRIIRQKRGSAEFLTKLFRSEGGISFSHIPTHTRSSDPYVSSLSEKSVPHRYPCEISVTNTRYATRGRLLMWDNIFGAWLYSFENESWIVVSQEKNQCWIFQRFKSAFNLY